MKYSIYQVIPDGIITAVVKLLEKVYSSGERAVFFSPLIERVDVINKALWTFSTTAFIPHGDKNLGFSDMQPIYFTDKFENPNNASVLVLMDTFDITNSSYETFARIMLIFGDSSKVKEAEEIYRNLKEGGKNVNYWKQSPKGWEQLS